MFIVVWTDVHGVDQYAAYETIETARGWYAHVKGLANTYTASICAVVESTDYDSAAS